MIYALAALARMRPVRLDVDDTDEALLARHRAGDRAAFAAIYRAHATAVYRRLSRLLGPVPEREDLTQDVFVALYAAIPRFRGEAKLSTLIHRIAINKACELLRRRRQRPATLMDGAFFDELCGPTSSPEDHALTRSELVRVFACLTKIKPKKRVALLLRIVDGLSFAEIGELVDATPETAAKRVQLGQRELDVLLARNEVSS